MRGVIRSAVALAVGRRARRRWVLQVFGGALLMPFYLFGQMVVAGFWYATRWSQLDGQLVAYLIALPCAMVIGLLPMAHTLETAILRIVLGIDIPAPTGAAARGWPTRFRASMWFTLHLALGGLTSAASLTIPPSVVALTALPLVESSMRFGRRGDLLEYVDRGLDLGRPAALVGVALLVLLIVGSTVFGGLLERAAPVLLGMPPAERIARLERQTARLVERNRLAQELHDSVGHALSIVTVQATAAQRVLDRDPDFARRALAAITETTNNALAELDHVLGLLREEPTAAGRRPTLADLDRLIAMAGLAGADVRPEISGAVDHLPVPVSQELYRVVQEGLTNVIRHAGAVPVSLRIRVKPRQLRMTMTNPLRRPMPSDDHEAVGPGSGGQRLTELAERVASLGEHRAGGRGLTGIAERVATLGGRFRSVRTEEAWSMIVELPL